MMKFYQGKVVYITGGSSGIGLECAKLCAKLGAHVLVIARDEEKLKRAREEIYAQRKNPSQRVGWESLDVTDVKEVSRRVSEMVRKHGAPDVLIASAGASFADYFENITYEKFDEIMKVNVYGIRNIVHALFPYMKNKNSRIAIVSSLAGLVGVFGYTAYGTSKYAAVGFAECLRGELKRFGIAVSVVCPPEVDTPLLQKELEGAPIEARAVKKFAGLLQPEYVARVIMKGIAKNKFMIIPGFRARTSAFFHRHSGGKISRFVSDVLARKK